MSNERVRGAGGTTGGIGQFLVGLCMAVAGGYLLTNQVMVTTTWWRWGGYSAFGLSLIDRREPAPEEHLAAKLELLGRLVSRIDAATVLQPLELALVEIEALRLAKSHAVSSLGVKKLTARVKRSNPTSLATFRAAGFSPAGGNESMIDLILFL